MSFTPPSPAHEADNKNIDRHRHVRESRLAFTPLYVIVGAYRLCSDEKLYVPVWDKCRHGATRGATVALTWVRIESVSAGHVPDLGSQAFFTFKLQRKFVEWFLMKYAQIRCIVLATVPNGQQVALCNRAI